MFILALSVSTSTSAQLGFDIVRFKSGHVMARAVAVNENGNPVFVEYDTSGEEVGEIAEAANDYMDAWVMSGERYRQILARFNQIEEEGRESYTRGATILSRAAFESQANSFVTRDGKPLTNVPGLAENTESVYVRHRDQILIPDISPVLYEAPIDLSDAQNNPQGIDDNTMSVLLSKNGRALAASEHNIGYRVDFFKDSDDNPILRASEHERVYQGIPNVPVETVSGYIDGHAVTDENGAYSTSYLIAPCPGFHMDYTTYSYAKLRYRRFNPRGNTHGLFTLQSPGYDTCNGIGANLAASGNLLGLMTYVNLLGMQATRAIYNYPSNFYVDSAVISGQGKLANPAPEAQSTLNSSEEVNIGERTAFQYEAPDDAPLAQKNFDFDGDEKIDRSVLGDWENYNNPETGESEKRFVKSDNGKLQGVYFSTGTRNPDLPLADPQSQPDLVRLADKAEDFRHQGLLESISAEDLKDTDLYVFRESNGTLVTHRRGLREEEVRGGRDAGVDEDNSTIYYQFLVRGPRSNSVVYRDFSAFQSDAQMNPELHERASDHLRAQEPIKIVAINRRSGYIGTVSAQYMDSQIPGLISFPVDDLVMRPPNLKVLAERKTRIEAGMTKCESADCEDEYLIGYEGAATTNDTILTITTEWVDHDGAPLPEGLGEYGYTGRLAKVTGGNTLSVDGGQLAQFPIKPGRHLQTIRLKGDYDTSEHFYLQINGEPENESPDFSTLGAAEEGPLKYRPKHYVPFMVPLEDQDATIRQYNAYRKLKRDESVPNDELRDFGPVHRWYYRPEMQFSMFQLEVKNIFRQMEEEGSEAIDIYPEDTPVIASSDDIIKVAYDLIEQQFKALPYLGPGQELVFAFGEEEVAAKLDEDANVVFTNIEHFAALDPEDFLSIRMYNNHDPSNILWQFAFQYIYIEPRTIGYNNQTDDTYYITADDPTVDLKSGVAGYAYQDPETKTPVSIEWKVAGDGTFDNPRETSDDLGVFDATLTMSRTKGAKADVSVELIDSEAKAEWKTVEVLAGKPHRIEVSKSGQAVSLSQGDVRLDVRVYDRYNNLVEDGTEVDFDFADNFLVRNERLNTENGIAFIELTGGEYAVDESAITITSGTVSREELLSVQGLNVSIAASKEILDKQETVSLTATITKLDGSPASNVPVSFSATRGVLGVQEVFTGSSGVVSTTFKAGLNEMEGTWYAQVGYVGADQLDYRVQSNGASINALDTMLVADESKDGEITYEYLGITSTLPYETDGSVNVRLEADATIRIGDLADPNLEPLVSFSMNELATVSGETVLMDSHQLNNATTNNISIVNDHPLGAGRSALFNAESTATIEGQSAFNLTQNIGMRLDIRPNGDGNIVDYANGTQQLSYNAGTLTYTLKTADGTQTVSAPNVTNLQWHRVATRFSGGVMELYVNGVVYSNTVTGTLEYGSSSDIVIGGLPATIRGFRIYDWSSANLITFEDGTTEKPLQAGSQDLVVKSLGNLGGAIAGSELKSLRVAIIADNQRNYASLLTKRGYQEISSTYFNTVSPQVPALADYINNPLGGLVPTAQAWTWGGVWDSVKSAVSYIIPYEDFIIIGEQLIYLVNQDWKNFSATKLAFASLGAATIIPIAKPLKPLLAPLKKVVDAMGRFPGAKHFAGGIGTAVKSALGGKTDKLWNLLPFILIAVELYESPEVFDFIMNAIKSEEDLWTWVEYIGEVVTAAGGLDSLASVQRTHESVDLRIANPISWIVQTSSATPRRQVAARIIRTIKRTSRGLNDPGKVTKILRPFMKGIKPPNPGHLSLKKLLTNSTAIRAFALNGAAKTRAFIRESKKWRVNRWFVLFALGYIVEEVEAGRLSLGGGDRLLDLVADIFSTRAWVQQGALFQLSQVVYFHIQNQYGLQQPKVVGIELVRPAFLILNGLEMGNAYRREVDIVLESDNADGEVWVETKSLVGPFDKNWFQNTLTPKDRKDTESALRKRGYYRQFFHDMRLNTEFTNPRFRNRIFGGDRTWAGNKDYKWYFHKFSMKHGRPPSSVDERKARAWLCSTANVRNKSDFYKENLIGDAKSTQLECERSRNRISLRDTQTYISDVLKPFASSDKLDIANFIEVVETLLD